MRLRPGDRVVVSCSSGRLLDLLGAAVEVVRQFDLVPCFYSGIPPRQGTVTSSPHFEARRDLAQSGVMISILGLTPSGLVEPDWTFDVLSEAVARGTSALLYVVTEKNGDHVSLPADTRFRTVSSKNHLQDALEADLRELIAGER